MPLIFLARKIAKSNQNHQIANQNQLIQNYTNTTSTCKQAMSILLPRQKEELHKAVLQYLRPLFADAEKDSLVLTEVLNITTADDIIPNYLEKKWATVLRLQKKILDLENDVNSYKLLLDQNLVVLPKDRVNWLPSACTKTFKTQTLQLVNSSTLHPALPTVLAGCSDGTVVSWNLGDENSVPRSFAAHTRAINGLAWSRVPLEISGKKTHVLASCSSDLSIKIWEADSYKHIRTLTGHEHTVSAVVFSPTNPNILYSVSRDKAVRVWDLTTGNCLHKFVGHSDWVRDVDAVLVQSQFSLLAPESRAETHGDFLLTCANDQSVRLSHAESGTGLALLLGHGHVVETVRFLPALSNALVDKYLVQSKNPYLPEGIVDEPVYAQLGFKYCVSGGRDNTIKLWLLPPPTLRPRRPPMASAHHSQGWHIADLVGHQSWVKSLEVHPNGRFLMSAGDDKTVRVWDLATLAETGKVACIKTLVAHEGFVNSVHFARFECAEENDREKMLKAIEGGMRCLFVSGGVDSTVRLWS